MKVLLTQHSVVWIILPAMLEKSELKSFIWKFHMEECVPLFHRVTPSSILCGTLGGEWHGVGNVQALLVNLPHFVYHTHLIWAQQSKKRGKISQSFQTYKSAFQCLVCRAEEAAEQGQPHSRGVTPLPPCPRPWVGLRGFIVPWTPPKSPTFLILSHSFTLTLWFAKRVRTGKTSSFWIIRYYFKRHHTVPCYNPSWILSTAGKRWVRETISLGNKGL